MTVETIVIRTREDFERLSPAVQQQVREQRQGKRIRSHVKHWARVCPPTIYGPMRPYGWQDDVFEHMDASIRRLASRRPDQAKTVQILLFDAPQQSGKSEATKIAVAAALASGVSVGVLCYNAEFARAWGRDARRLLRSKEALAAWPHLVIPDGDDEDSRRARRDQTDAMTRWTVPHPDPERPPVLFASSGREGGLEGLTLGLVVCDDLYKTITDAQSGANNRLVNDLLTSSALGRVNDYGGEIWDIGTRRGKRDTKGFWLAHKARSEAEGEPLAVRRHTYPLRGREPWRYGERGYITPRWTEGKEKQARGTFGKFAGPLLDQTDIDDVGGLFSREAVEHTYPEHPSVVEVNADAVWVTIDGAQTSGDGDFTTIQTWAIRGEFSDLIDQVRGQWDELGVIRELRAVIERRKPRRVLAEDASSGRVAYLALRQLFPQIELVPTSGRGSKRDQIQGTMSLWLRGLVRLPVPANDPGWCYTEDDDGLNLPTRLLRLRGDRPDMRGEVDDEADAACQFLRYRMESGAMAKDSYWDELSAFG